jgi:hypothetical protein
MPGSEDKELIKNVRASRDQNGKLLISSVCEKLKEQGFNVSGTMVSYFCPSEEMYTFIGNDPIPVQKDGVAIENLSNNRLYLKFRPGNDSSPRGIKAAPIPNAMNMQQQPGKL